LQNLWKHCKPAWQLLKNECLMLAFLAKPEVLQLEQFNFEMQPVASNVTSALLVKLPAFGGSLHFKRRLRALQF